MRLKKKKEISNRLTREIWNQLIAEPKNENGQFQVSPGKLRTIISTILKL